MFFANKKIARLNWDRKSWEEGMTVDTNSVRYLLRRSSKNCDLRCANIDRHIYTIILLKSVCLSVGVRKLQVAILARSSREMSLTVRIVWQYISCHEFASQFGLAFFYTRKTSINYRYETFSSKFILNEKGRNARLAGDRSTMSVKNTSG